jgi:hypothetical protein
MIRYDVGDLVTLTCKFTTSDGVATNPGTVVLKVLSPADTVTTITEADMLNPVPGTWTYNLLLTQSGQWTYRFAGTQGVIAAGENTITVKTTAFS